MAPKPVLQMRQVLTVEPSAISIGELPDKGENRYVRQAALIPAKRASTFETCVELF